jgi:hypothetical protein
MTATSPPEIDPIAWEDFAVFRETFLVCVTPPKHNATLRAVADLLHETAPAAEWPEHPGGWLRAQLRAVVADLRHLEGFLVTLAVTPSPDPYEGALHRTAVLMSREIASVAQHIGDKLDSVEKGAE